MGARRFLRRWRVPCRSGRLRTTRRRARQRACPCEKRLPGPGSPGSPRATHSPGSLAMIARRSRQVVTFVVVSVGATQHDRGHAEDPDDSPVHARQAMVDSGPVGSRSMMDMLPISARAAVTAPTHRQPAGKHMLSETDDGGTACQHGDEGGRNGQPVGAGSHDVPRVVRGHVAADEGEVPPRVRWEVAYCRSATACSRVRVRSRTRL